MRSRNDLRDFMELDSKEGREGEGRGEKERSIGFSSGKRETRLSVVAIWKPAREESKINKR
jgi:hypothetical protein